MIFQLGLELIFGGCADYLLICNDFRMTEGHSDPFNLIFWKHEWQNFFESTQCDELNSKNFKAQNHIQKFFLWKFEIKSSKCKRYEFPAKNRSTPSNNVIDITVECQSMIKENTQILEKINSLNKNIIDFIKKFNRRFSVFVKNVINYFDNYFFGCILWLRHIMMNTKYIQRSYWQSNCLHFLQTLGDFLLKNDITLHLS